MNELVQYCNQPTNHIDVRQARIFRTYLIASLMNLSGVDTVRVYRNGACYRESSFT